MYSAQMIFVLLQAFFTNSGSPITAGDPLQERAISVISVSDILPAVLISSQLQLCDMDSM